MNEEHEQQDDRVEAVEELLPGTTEFERWLRHELASRYVALMREGEDELIAELESLKPAGIVSGAVAQAERRYGIDVAGLQPWTCRGGVWKRW